MIEIDDGIPPPKNPRLVKVEAARQFYNSNDVSKKEAARQILASEGFDGFNSFDAAIQYIERRL